MSAQKKGFTLIELLVIIAIIAILAVIGVTVFSGVQKNARDAKRKTDVESIAKAYEAKANAGKYSAILNSDFASGSKPKDPNSAKGDYFNWLDSNGVGFKVCASMDNNPNNTCNTPATSCYCQFSSQGSIPPSSIADSSSTNTSGGLGGSSPAPACDPNGILTSGLVGYWKMDEASSPFFDYSGNNSGNWIGGVSSSSDVKNVFFIRSGSFNGNNSYVDLGDPFSDNLDMSDHDLSVSVWFKANIAQANYAGIVNKVTGGWPKFSGWAVTLNGKKLSIFFNDGGSSIGWSSGSILYNDASWHHVIAVFDRDQNLTVYVDGVQKTPVVNISAKKTSNIAPAINAYIGNNNRVGNSNFTGKIDDVRIYNRVLSGSEVSALYNGGDGCIPS